MAIPDGSSAQGSIKRYITTHNPNGKSVYLQSCPQIWRSLPDVGKVSRSYAVEKIPVNLQDDTDVNIFKASSGQASYTTPDIVVAPQGANLSIVELEPGGSSTMHQTKSIDFSICVSGVIDHELDGGETVRLNPGDHIVQRGTMHRWLNGSQTEPAKFVAVTLPCEKLVVAGKQIEEVHLPRGSSLKSKL